MSKFTWEISEPADNAAQGSPSGTVRLDDVKIVTVVPWSIQNPDGSQALPPQPGGEVDLSGRTESPWRISRGVWNFALIVGVVVLGFIMIHDAIFGNLSFEKLIWVIGPLLVGLDVASRKGRK
jgi:hypothetical protein